MENFLPETSARNLAATVFKHKWSIFTVFVAATLGAVFWLWFIRDDIYATSARVLVKIGREQAPPPTVLGASPLVVGYRSAEVNSEMEILQSAQLLGQVVDELRLDRPEPPKPAPQEFVPRARYCVKKAVSAFRDWEDEALISIGLRERMTPRERVLYTLQKGLTVKAAKDSNVFVAVLGTPYRKGGSRVLDRLLDDYLEYRQRIYQTRDYDFFNSQVQASLAELRNAELQLQNFENRENINLFPKQEEVLLEQISRQSAVANDAALARNEALLKVHALEGELAKNEPNFGAIGEFPRESFEQNVVNQLADLQREREKLRMTELDSGDRIKSNRAQFQALAAMLGASLRAALAARQASYGSQKAALDGMENEIHARHARWNDWIVLKRKVADLEGNYLTYRKKLDETRAESDMQEQQIGNIAVIERPIDPIQPVGIRKTTLLGLSLLVAAFLALGWVAIAEFLDRRVYSAAELERQFGLSVLAEIPERRAA